MAAAAWLSRIRQQDHPSAAIPMSNCRRSGNSSINVIAFEISRAQVGCRGGRANKEVADAARSLALLSGITHLPRLDRKSTRLNSSHQIISYAVFCLKKKKQDMLSY